MTLPAGSRRDVTHRALQTRLLRFAEVLTARPWLVIAVWFVVIAGCTPFALRLDSVLTEQGASKVVAGTSSARAEQHIQKSFPAHSELGLTVTVQAPDVYSPTVRTLLSELDGQIAARVSTGQVLRTTSAFTVHRDATVEYLRQVREQLDRRLQATARTTTRTTTEVAADGLDGTAEIATRRQLVGAEVAACRIPAALRDLVRSAVSTDDSAAITRLASGYAATTDWRGYPVPVPAEAVDRLISADGRVTLVSVSFSRQAGDDPDVDWLRETVTRLVGDQGLGATVRTHVTGELALIHDTYEKAEADNAVMETAAYGIILVVLLLFFRAVVPAVLTLVGIGLAMNVSQAALFALGHQVTLTQFTVTIMTFVMLGAGVDYSMLLSSRYRQERLAGRSPREAVVYATAHAGESMLLAGLVVALAFGATLLAPVDWIPPLGYGGLVGIPIILAAALTLTPCLLMVLGDRFFALGYRPLTDLEHHSFLGRHLGRAAHLARRRKVAVVLVFAALTVPFAVVTARHTSTADPVALSPATDSRAGYELIAEKWGEAAVLPTVIAGQTDPGVAECGMLTADGHRAVSALTDRLAKVDGVARVDAVTRPFGTPRTAEQTTAMPVSLRQDHLADDGGLRIVVTLRDPPYSAAAMDTVTRLQDVLAGESAVGALDIGGATQVDRQYGAALRTSLWQMVALVSIGVFIVLTVALRSLLVPIRLIATIMMSNVLAIGMTVLIFDAWLGKPIINDLPIFLIVLMMGLGMDYEIFLITRVRDLVKSGADQETATTRAVVDTGRVINAAGLVMAGSLGAMTLSSTVMLQEYGTGLGLAVLLDATVIRMLFVPATLLLLRRYNWWLPRLGRQRTQLAKAG